MQVRIIQRSARDSRKRSGLVDLIASQATLTTRRQQSLSEVGEKSSDDEDLRNLRGTMVVVRLTQTAGK